MDYIKIGKFIMSERKAKQLTQAKLAEKLFVSEKTVSKWENGKGVPDTNLLPKLCNIFEINLNELLNGERISSDKYKNVAESKLLELQKIKELNDRRLLKLEILVMFLGLVFLFSFISISSFIQMADWLRILLYSLSIFIVAIAVIVSLRIEQVAGYYECKKCHHKYIPTYKQISFSMHMGRTRYLKCPNCGKKSWNKKVIK